MIDFIRTELIDVNAVDLLQNPKLEFLRNFDNRTGEVLATNKSGERITGRAKAIYKNLEFTVYDNGRVFLNGSLHKFWNDGKHNFNDFDTTAIINVLNKLNDLFSINPANMVLKQLEIGVNIISPYKTNEILKYCYLHGTKNFEYIINSKRGKHIQAHHDRYVVKIYDKALQYRAGQYKVPNNDILRFEIKYRKMQKLKSLNIKTVQDVINVGLHRFTPLLLAEWNKVVLFDPTIKKQTNYSNPIFWDEIKADKHKLSRARKSLKRMSKNSGSDIHEKIRLLINNKATKMTETRPLHRTFEDEKRDLCTVLSERKTRPLHRTFENKKPPPYIYTPPPKKEPILEQLKKAKTRPLHHLDKVCKGNITYFQPPPPKPIPTTPEISGIIGDDLGDLDLIYRERWE